VLGPDHPEILVSRNNLALAYQAAGRATEAIVLHERTVADMERVLGPDHPNTLTSRGNLALAYQAAGRAAEAIELHARTLADMERVLGRDHPHIMQARKTSPLPAAPGNTMPTIR
jgi:tetratricopeptide (TPR) repeat protein